MESFNAVDPGDMQEGTIEKWARGLGRGRADDLVASWQSSKPSEPDRQFEAHEIAAALSLAKNADEDVMAAAMLMYIRELPKDRVECLEQIRAFKRRAAEIQAGLERKTPAEATVGKATVRRTSGKAAGNT